MVEVVALWTRAAEIYDAICSCGVATEPERLIHASQALVDTLGNLACAAFERGDIAEADAIFRQMQIMLEKSGGANWQHPTVATFARVLLSRGERAKAEHILKKATEKAPPLQSVHQWAYPECLSLLGDLYRQSSRFVESEQCLLEAARFMSTLPNSEIEAVALVYDGLHALYLDTHRTEDAERLRKQIALLRDTGKQSRT